MNHKLDVAIKHFNLDQISVGADETVRYAIELSKRAFVLEQNLGEGDI